MENKFANKGIEGINIYHDKKGQIVYLDFFTKNGYVITPQKEKSFKTLSNVLLYTALVGIFFYVLFEFPLWISVASMVIVGGFLEWRFRKFLNNCTVIKNFKPEKKNDYFDHEQSTTLVIVKAILYFVLAILLFITVFLYKDSDKTINAISVAAAVACLYISFKYISVIISRNRK